jgi:DUF1680 family protein
MRPQTRFILSLLTILSVGWLRADAQQNPAGLARPGTARIADRLTPLPPAAVHLEGGLLGTRVAVNERVRLLHVDENDMLDAFERRNAPHQDWQGEHVGKFLHAATLAWQNTGDAALKAKLDRVVARLLKTQEADGYLGTYPPAHRWTSWDVWVHKYDLLGLLTYTQYTGDPAALRACRRVGDLLIRTFGTARGQRDINRSGEHMGMAPDSVLEAVVLLYRATDDPRYLRFARYIVSNYDAPGGPAILASLEKYRSVRRVANAKAYEMLSNFNGLLELYRATGDRRLLNAMLTAWQDVAQNRLYLTGSASSYEVFQDDFHLPNGMKSNICETCVTVTWEQLNLQLLRLTGEPKFADQLERSIYNHLLGAQKPTGDDWAYYTPLAGSKPYDAATTCCHSSGPRGVALIPEFVVMTGADGGVVVNLYTPGIATAPIVAESKTGKRPGKITLQILTDYPKSGRVDIRLTAVPPGAHFPLSLRIPAWTPAANVRINEAQRPLLARPGTYLTLDRNWRKGDTVTLNITLPTHLVMGDHENAGRAAVTYGPLVLALDTACNPKVTRLASAELAAATQVDFHLAPPQGRPETGLTFTTRGRVGPQSGALTLTLTPYADAGGNGKSRYEVWIPLPGHAASQTSGSAFLGTAAAVSRAGNVRGDINDDDTDTFTVTYNGQRAEEDWYAVIRPTPVLINRVVYAHGRAFHDGGWFDTSAGKPKIQVQTEIDGPWKTVATLDSYPDATATDPMGLQDGQKFEATFAPISAVAVRILGKPACGDSPAQAFSSCAELQAYSKL